MKKRRRKSSQILTLADNTPGGEAVHFRLCHVCMHLNESSQEILNCEKCQRHLTIENLVEERLRQRRADGRAGESEEDSEDEEMEEEYIAQQRGLYGLAVLW